MDHRALATCLALSLTAHRASADDAPAPSQKIEGAFRLDFARTSFPLASRDLDVTLKSGDRTLTSTHKGAGLALGRADFASVGVGARLVFPSDLPVRPTFGVFIAQLGIATTNHPVPVPLDGAGGWEAKSLVTSNAGIHGGALLPLGRFALAVEARVGLEVTFLSLARAGAAPANVPPSGPTIEGRGLRPMLGGMPSSTGRPLADGEGSATSLTAFGAVRASAEWNVAGALGIYAFGEIGAPGGTSYVGGGVQWLLR